MGLKQKASKVDFSALPGVGMISTTEASARPKTAPGAMMAFANDARSELMQENEQLRARVSKSEEIQSKLDEALGDLQQWQGAKATRMIDPALIVRSQFANRHALNFAGTEFEQLKLEIQEAGGNVQPIKVRPISRADEGLKYEIVFGHRRHEACRQLGISVLAVVDNLDDRALFVEMDRENRAREDLSAWEQGTMYRRALDKGLYPSNRKLAEAVGVDLSAMGKALALADLPDDVVAAFPSPLELQFRWAKPLADALAANPDGVLARARELKKHRGKIAARGVFERLILGGAGGGVEPFHPPKSIHIDVLGKRAVTITVSRKGGATVTIAPGVIHASQAQPLAEVIAQFLQASKDRT